MFLSSLAFLGLASGAISGNLNTLVNRLKSEDDDDSAEATIRNQMAKMLKTQTVLVAQEQALVDELKQLINAQTNPPPSYFGALRTELDKYPDYGGDLAIEGWVEVLALDDGALELRYDLSGLEASTMGGFHIHAGTSCYDKNLPGGHYFNLTTDPWSAGSKWTSDAKGLGTGNVKINSGFATLLENTGHVIVVHQADDTRAACGVLSPLGALTTNQFAPYPGYSGDQKEIGGRVVVSEVDGQLQLAYDFHGLEPSTDGGFHIHVGMSCTEPGKILGHHFNAALGVDPWPKGSKWTSDDNGAGHGTINIDSGYLNLVTNVGHTVVIHTHDDTRAACAELRPLKSVLTSMAPYPGYEGTTMILGNVTASVANNGDAVLAWQLEGLERDTYGGIHIHAGTTCDKAGGHWFDSKKLTADPWSRSLWVSGGSGFSVGTSSITDGYAELTQNYHHAVVVHTHDGTRSACGELTMPLEFLEAKLASYPSGGDDSVSGTIQVSEEETGKLVVDWDVSGLTGVAAGFVAIRTGTSCASSDLGPNYYGYTGTDGKPYEPATDPWAQAKWTSEEGSAAKGTFKVDVGMYGLQGPLGKVAVLYDASTGKSVACGLLQGQDKSWGADTAKPTPFPTASPSFSAPTPAPTHASPMPDLKLLLANNSRVSTQTCAVMPAGFGGQFGRAIPFNMTVNACAAVAPIHFPSASAVKAGDGYYDVTVTLTHPVQEHDHWIEWLFLTGPDDTPIEWKKISQPADSEPVPVSATFRVKGGQEVHPYIYCNLHGLWEGTVVTLN